MVYAFQAADMGTTRAHPTSRSGASSSAATDAPAAFVPFGRAKATSRALLRLVAAAVILTTAWSVLSQMSFSGGDRTSVIVRVAVVLVVVPFALVGVAITASGLRWLAAACWPGALGVRADTETLTMALGPFGTRRYDVGRLDVRYLFECTDDEETDTFEAMRPEAQQIRDLLPIIRHPDAGERIDRVILRFADGPEPAVVSALRPVVAIWRGEAPDPEAET